MLDNEMIQDATKMIKSISERLNKLKGNPDKDAKIKEVKINLNKTIHNTKTLPYFINDSFKTRKTVAHYVRNSNIRINARNSNLQTNINELKANNGIRFKFEEQIENIEDPRELMEKLGIIKIKRLETYENIEYKPNINSQDKIYRRMIFNLLLEYFIRTDEIIDPEYNIGNNTLDEYNPKVQKSALKLRKKKYLFRELMNRI